MKTNTQRLVDALQQVDDGNWIDDDRGGNLGLDGLWDTEALNGAIDTHLVPLSSVSKAEDPNAMYLRERWASGTTDDGREFEVSASGVLLILAVGKFGTPEREMHTIHLADLVPAWLRTIGAVKPGA